MRWPQGVGWGTASVFHHFWFGESRKCIAEKYSPIFGYEIDPETEIVVTCGSTEAMMAAMMTVCNPGDKDDCIQPLL